MFKPRRFVIFLLFFPVFIGLTVHSAPVSADYQQAYSTYANTYQKYRQDYNAFQTAKSTYLTYKTLSAQNDAQTAFQTVLNSRNQLMSLYYSLLLEKLVTSPGASPGDITTFQTIKNSEQAWLAADQTKIAAAASFDDLNNVSGEYDSRYPQMDTETRQALGTILLAKELVLRRNTDVLTASLSAKLGTFRANGTDTSIWDREIISAQSKLDLQSAKYAEAQNIYLAKTNNTVDLVAGQQKLTEANQYLRETVNYLSEILKSILG